MADSVIDEDGNEWCHDTAAHRERWAFCEDHQVAWCPVCSRQCDQCVDDPRCPDCGCSLFTDYHEWDCSYEDD
jgi:hypothetical protein